MLRSPSFALSALFRRATNVCQRSFQGVKRHRYAVLGVALGTGALLSSRSFSEESGLASAQKSVVIDYENKIRFFSTPEKVFNYFASVEKDGESFMTEDDFILSLTPSMTRDAPDNAETESFSIMSSTRAPGSSGALKNTRVSHHEAEKAQKKSKHFSSMSVLELIDASGDGLISFDEYLFCLTLLSIPPTSFELAFAMFDMDGNGKIEASEWETVMHSMRARSGMSDQRLEKFGALEGNDQMLDAFFGEKRDKQLSSGEFVGFVKRLQDEITTLEFRHYDQKNTGLIGMHQLVQLVVCHSPDRDHARQLKPELKKEVSLDEWLVVSNVVQEIQKIEEAIDFYREDCETVSVDDFVRASKAVCGVNMNERISEALFTVFGASQVDGKLSVDKKEFFQVLKQRSTRFETKQRDTGTLRFLGCLKQCAKASFKKLTE